MSHGNHQHSHGISSETDIRRLTIALILILGLMVGELVAGFLAHSLALLSDAAHMLTDAFALGLALVAARLAKRPAKGILTYGYKRTEILSAQINGITLLILALVIVYEGIVRLSSPPEVAADVVLILALVGMVVNLAATLILAKANRESLNVEGSFQHILTDLYAFIGTAVAAIVILTTNFNRADAIASLLVAGLMLRSAYGLLRESGRIFMEAAPRGMNPENIGNALAAAPGVVEVHDLHVWEVTSGFPALSAHVLVKDDVNCHRTRRELETILHNRFNITHTTLQVDHEGGDLLMVEFREPRSDSE